MRTWDDQVFPDMSAQHLGLERGGIRLRAAEGVRRRGAPTPPGTPTGPGTPCPGAARPTPLSARPVGRARACPVHSGGPAPAGKSAITDFPVASANRSTTSTIADESTLSTHSPSRNRFAVVRLLLPRPGTQDWSSSHPLDLAFAICQLPYANSLCPPRSPCGFVSRPAGALRPAVAGRTTGWGCRATRSPVGANVTDGLDGPGPYGAAVCSPTADTACRARQR